MQVYVQCLQGRLYLIGNSQLKVQPTAKSKSNSSSVAWESETDLGAIKLN
jgi:hypothetical protein